MFVTQNVKIVKFVMIFAYVRVLYYIYFLSWKKKKLSTKNEEIMFLVTLIRKLETLFILLAISSYKKHITLF